MRKMRSSKAIESKITIYDSELKTLKSMIKKAKGIQKEHLKQRYDIVNSKYQELKWVLCYPSTMGFKVNKKEDEPYGSQET